MKRNKLLTLLIGVCLVLALVALPFMTACAPEGEEEEEEEEEEDEEVKVLHWGSVHPLTGPMSPYGICEAYGTKFAVDEINAAGGIVIGGQKYIIELHEFDGRWDPKTEVAGNELMVEFGCKFITNCSIGLVAAQETLEAAKVISVTPGLPKEITREGIKYTFRTAWGEVGGYFYGFLVGPTGADTMFTGVDKVAIFTEHGATPLDSRDWFLETLNPEIEVVYDEIVDTEATQDYTAVLAAIRATDPDLLFLNGTYSTNMLYVYPQMAEMGWTPQVLSQDPLMGRGAPAWKIGGPAAVGAVERTYFYPYEVEPPEWGAELLGFDPEKRDSFNTNFLAEYGPDWMGSCSVHGYDFVYGMLFNAQLAGTIDDADAIVAAIETETPYAGAMAETFWYKNGHYFILLPLMVRVTYVDEVTGAYEIEYLGGGNALDYTCKRWEVRVDEQVDCKQMRVVPGY